MIAIPKRGTAISLPLAATFPLPPAGGTSTCSGQDGTGAVVRPNAIH